MSEQEKHAELVRKVEEERREVERMKEATRKEKEEMEVWGLLSSFSEDELKQSNWLITHTQHTPYLTHTHTHTTHTHTHTTHTHHHTHSHTHTLNHTHRRSFFSWRRNMVTCKS